MLLVMIISATVFTWGAAVSGVLMWESQIISKVMTDDQLMIDSPGEYRVEVYTDQNATVQINNITLNLTNERKSIIINVPESLNITVSGTAGIIIFKIKPVILIPLPIAILLGILAFIIGSVIFSLYERKNADKEVELNEITQHTFDRGTLLRAAGPGLSLIAFTIFIVAISPFIPSEKHQIPGIILVVSPFLVLLFSYRLVDFLGPTPGDYTRLARALQDALSRQSQVDLSGWKRYGQYIYSRNIEMVSVLIKRKEISAKLYGDMLVRVLRR